MQILAQAVDMLPSFTNTMVQESVVAAAKRWTEIDPNPVTIRYVQGMIEQSGVNPSAASELARLFPIDNSRVSFGTAGLRAEMKPGPLGMNDLVVIQTAQGLARYCKEHDIAKVVIGYDHRSRPEFEVSSHSFAIFSTLCFRHAGIQVLLLDGFVATPMVPFTLTQLSPERALGIMITASHNPKFDAGYKIYWTDGCQIRSPTDKEIANVILQNLTPWTDYRAEYLKLRQTAATDGTCFGLADAAMTANMIDAYFSAIASTGLISDRSSHSHPESNVRFCYSAMHGVGYPFAKRVFEVFALPAFLSVPSQQDPDPNFSTVVFPNPEEKGALNIAQSFASEHGCNIILANDPDADRLAVAEFDSSSASWVIFTGDQLGAMLGHWMWQKYRDKSTKPLAMCASTVSSNMLREIAKVEGFHFEDTLTGFKWIGSRARELNAGGYHSIFCYEEAIGFCCGGIVFDKDGITALGVLADLSLSVYARGQTLSQHMQTLYDKYGEFVSNNGYFSLPDVSLVQTIMNELTNNGACNTLSMVGPFQVEGIRYLGEPGFDSTTPDKKPILPTSEASPMLSLYFSNGLICQFRASGTEPKFKYYIELKGRPGVPRAQVWRDLQEMSGIVLQALFSKYGLS